MLRFAAIFLFALVVGFVGVRVRPPEQVAGPVAEVRQEARDRAKSWQQDDFSRWIREKEPGRGLNMVPNPVAEDLKAWSDEELRTALDDALLDPSGALPNGKANTVIGWLIEEWMSRDPDSVVAWFEGLGSESKKRRMASLLGAYWPQDRGEEGLALVIRNREFFDPPGAINSWAFVQLAIESAAQRGPAEVEAVLAQLRAHKLDPRYGNPGSFPKGFDFAALAESPAAAAFLAEGNAFFAGHWMKEDPEGAFDFFKAGLTLEDRNGVGKLFYDILPKAGDVDPDAAAARAEWLASRLDTFEPGDRRKIAIDAVKALGDHPAVAGGFVAALEDRDDQSEASRAAATRLFERGFDPAMEFFEATGDARRLELLEEATLGRPEWKTWLRERDERRLRERLAAWGAPHERIDAIVRSMKEVTE
jgi:hypothetical protein